MIIDDSSAELIIAAEDFPSGDFQKFHVFSEFEEKIVNKIVAHGPVLLRGGRGSGKSALMIEADRRLWPKNPASTVIGIYVNLKRMALLYENDRRGIEKLICDFIYEETCKTCQSELPILGLERWYTTTEMRDDLQKISSILQKRIVLLFDDVTHIAREVSGEVFFDIFRTISSSTISCKASIYPGVTYFGKRFDIYNDATTIEISRNESLPGFRELFTKILNTRFASMFKDENFDSQLSRESVSHFLARAVLGNMRGFVYACQALALQVADRQKMGYPEITKAMLDLSSNHFWPSLDEVEPKLGKYSSLIKSVQDVGSIIFAESGKQSQGSILVFKDIHARLIKIFEILEYVGFISKREASRAMKSGGRGTRYALNLCNLLEHVPQTRLTYENFEKWSSTKDASIQQFHSSSSLDKIVVPEPTESNEIAILGLDVAQLKRSKAYPYGLTDDKITKLRENGFATVRDLLSASDEQLSSIKGIKKEWIARIRAVLSQAVWM